MPPQTADPDPEPPEDEDALSPRERGRFVHEVMQRFFEAWDAQTGRAAIDVARLDEARAVWARVAEPAGPGSRT